MAHQKRRLGCDPPHEAASLSAVLAHAHECAARAPRHRDRLARRLTTDPPFLFMLGWRLARWRLAVCGACSRTRVRSASSSPPTHHRTTARNRSAASGHGCWRLANCRALAARCLRCLLTHMSALRELFATETPSHSASKPICHFCLSREAGWGLRIAQN